MDAYIVETVRAPVGRRNGGLSQVHPADLGAHVLSALVERSGIPAESVDDVIFGCLDPIGAQAANIARTSWLAAGLPYSVPGVTIDRQCGSSQQAVHFAAQAVMSGTQDLVVAGGVQNMSAIPIARSWNVPDLTFPEPFLGSKGWVARFGDGEVSQFLAADRIAEKWGLDREAMDDYALESHRRAVAAIDAGFFDAEIEPYGDIRSDEGPRRDPDPQKMKSLSPLRPGGRVTAATASQISDGASALLIASERGLERFGLEPRGRIHTMVACGSDPVLMLTGPIDATSMALERAGLSVDDIDLFEVNEAFASVVMAWMAETGADSARTNVNGGAIALGHPLGATGGRLMTSLLDHLGRTGGRFGLQAMCEGGGTANATIIENLMR